MTPTKELQKQYNTFSKKLVKDRARLAKLKESKSISDSAALEIENVLNEVERLLNETLEILNVLE